MTPRGGRIAAIIGKHTTDVAGGPVPIRPQIEGYGVTTPAGRGGNVLRVTNTNDSGVGSFRAAVDDTTTPKYIVFETSGEIALQTRLFLKTSFTTIAGQTAPNPGITIRGPGNFVIDGRPTSVTDILIQHLRFRVGDEPGGSTIDSRDAFASNDTQRLVLDHCSISWSIDECLQIWDDITGTSEDITFWRCIVSESLHCSIHSKGCHSKCVIMKELIDKVCFIQNLWMHHDERWPRFDGTAALMLLNSICYNKGVGGWLQLLQAGELTRVSAVGNRYKNGPNTVSSEWINLDLANVTVDTESEVYLNDNSLNGTIPGDPWDAPLVDSGAGTVASQRINSPPAWWPSPVTVLANSAVEGIVLPNVGARPLNRDSVDTRVVSEYENGTGSIIDSQNDVGGWPTLAENMQAFDEGANPHGDDDGDGYTNIEEQLETLARALEP